MGVFADSSEKYLDKLEDDILGLTIDVLYDLKQQYPQDKLIGDDLQDLKDFRNRKTSTWKWPQSHHITTLFLGGNKSKFKDNEDIIMSFRKNE